MSRMRPRSVASSSRLVKPRFGSCVEPHDLLADHAADEEVAVPHRELVAGVDHQARDADRRHPHLRRLLHALAVRAGVNREAGGVVHAEADHRPSVIDLGLIRFSSSPPCGPCSLAHTSPVSG